MTDFVDSFAPIDAEIVTTDWPLPPVKPWEPKPSLFARLLAWVRGLVS